VVERSRKDIVGSSRTINEIIALGASCHFERDHALRVSELALQLFDGLQSLHAMGNTERIWLRAAALLHDIGKSEDRKRHHKVARDIILNSPELSFRWEERFVIALIVRYHRGAVPHGRHAYFGDLEADAQRCVERLAALLRLADGLDKGRSSLVKGVNCEIRAQCVRLQARSGALLAVDHVLRKADLFERVFGRRIVVDIRLTPHYSGSSLDSGVGLVYAESI